MISKIYIDNFRCFVNFEHKPQEIELILGRNGVGKTSVLDVIEILQNVIVHGMAVDDSKRGFLADTLTRWDQRSQQTFELEILGNGGTYQYRLEIEHDLDNLRCRISNEKLMFDKQCLYSFDGTEAQLYRDNPTWEPGPNLPLDWSRSFIASIPVRNDNTKLTWFRERVSRIYLYAIDPHGMLGVSDREQETPDRQLHDLVSWLRHLSQEAVDTLPKLLDSLKGILDGLQNFKLEKSSDTARTLKFEFAFEGVDRVNNPDTTYMLTTDRLSEGQRCLVALFSILHASIKADCSVFIDEPNNFVALEELQPWLVELHEKAYDSGCQLGLISHHPQMANYLAANHGVVLSRDNGGPTRKNVFEWNQDEASSPAELIARGME